MLQPNVSPAILRREFLVRSALLSGVGVLSHTFANPSVPTIPASPAEQLRLPVRLRTKFELFNDRKLFELPLDLPQPTIKKAGGQILWAELEPGSGRIEIKSTPANGAVFVTPPDGLLDTRKRSLRTKVIDALEDAGAQVEPLATFYADNSYYLPTQDDMKRVVAEVMTQSVGKFTLAAVAPTGNVPERFDCDDFAFAMKGLVAMRAYSETTLGQLAWAFGILIGDFRYIGAEHAVCFFVGDDQKVYIVDPRHQALAGQAPQLYTLGADECRRCGILLM